MFIQTADSAIVTRGVWRRVPDSERSLGLRALENGSSLSPLSCRKSRDHIPHRQYQQPPTALIIIITKTEFIAGAIIIQHYWKWK